jgi:hypothetical protein
VAKFNAKGDGVRVEGLDELRRALKSISASAPKELNAASKEVAGFVADDARSTAAGLGGVAAKVAPSIRGSGTARGGAIALGGSSYPMALGAEFGGQGRPTTQQFKPHKGRTGYFVYPAIRSNSERIEERYTDLLDDLMRKYDLL